MKRNLRQILEPLILAVIISLLVINLVGQLFIVQGTSMEPTLFDGDRVIVDKLSLRWRRPERGEIVVFRWPQDPQRKFIKRVIGLPGDEVMIRNNTVYVNRQQLQEPYINGPTYGDYGPVVVPDNRFFLLGDNRNYSDDSRFPDVGMVPRRLLVGRAVLILWPPDRLELLPVPVELEAIEG